MNQPTEKTHVILRLPVPVVDAIANIIAEKPYNQVVNLLNLIQQQANDQELQSYGPPAPPPPPKELS